MEHRWGRRTAIDVAVRFIVLPASIGTGRITNVSTTGAFLETCAQLRPMSLLYVEMIQMPNGHGGRSKRLSACVVRRTETGVGIEWCEPASKSLLYTQLLSAAQLEVAAGPTAGRRDLCSHQFDCLD